jgi:FkbM family methyltransferase
MNAVLLRKVRIALTPRNWLLRTRLNNGVLVAGLNRPGWGGRGVYLFGDTLEPELAALRHFVKPGYVFVDIGANTGVFTLKAAKEVGDSGLVIAVEPFLDVACQLSQNIHLNWFRNCRVRILCVGRATGQREFYMNGRKPNSFSLVRESGADSFSVLCVSLNDLCVWEGLTRLDYLKIDAEGAEEMILEGGAEAIVNFLPIIQVEVNKQCSALPQGYRRFSVPGSPNNLFIPSRRRDAMQMAKTHGWTERC